jgi:hypothetical protein
MRIEAVNAMTGMIAICKQEAAAQYRFLLVGKGSEWRSQAPYVRAAPVMASKSSPVGQALIWRQRLVDVPRDLAQPIEARKTARYHNHAQDRIEQLVAGQRFTAA